MSQQPRGRDAARWSRAFRTLAVATAVLIGVTAQPTIAGAAPPAGSAGATVSGELVAELAAGGTTDFVVYLRERATLDRAAQRSDPDARATEVYQELTGTAERTQRDLRAELDARKAPYDAYWIANALRVTGDRALVDAIAARPEVERIDPSREYALVEPERAAPETGRASTQAIGWNVTNVAAPQVWDEYGVRGEGIVVANIDSGVQFDHPALVGSYRGNTGSGFDHAYNWFDPAGVCADPAPCDNNDHGTHTMGTIVGDDGGDNQIGVAPGATWIAAKGCEARSCSDASLLAAGQWVLAPTDLNGENPRPDLRADIVNNSWGGDGGDLWYQQIVDSWRAAGMFPVFSAGNEGPGCGTAGSPSDYANSYAVGNYDINNNIASSSSRGASLVDGGIKPNISAPGSAVRSSVPDNTYANFTGTSMAAPHVAGAVALVWSASAALRGDIAATEALLDDTATDVDSLGCGGTVDDNNNFGEGRLNAYQAVTQAPRGPVGMAAGTVIEAITGEPLEGATISANGRSVRTAADGTYRMTLPAGDHDITASAYGFRSMTLTVTIPENGTAPVDFGLVETPETTVSGRVTDGSGHGWPLYAKIEVAGRPGGPIFTDPKTGRYSFTVPGNTEYRITTTAVYPGYQTVSQDLYVGMTAPTVNIAVPVTAACTAAGYRASLGEPLISESFDTTETPAGWSVVNRTEDGGWTFEDLGNRGNQTGGTGGFAIIDSDALGSGNTQDTDLRMPPLDFSDLSAPVLRFNSDWRAVGVSDFADIDVSVDGGTNWSNAWHQTASRRGPRIEEVPLTLVAGREEVLIRFRFGGTFAWWWEVDNVEVVNRSCTPVPGGLVTGFTTDQNTGDPLTGVTVSSVEEPLDRGVSAATPEDQNLPDGFYWLFSSLTGTREFTASKAPYAAHTRPVTVQPDGTVRADFALGAGRLTVSPGSIESHQPYGSVRQTKLTVTNTGSAPATVDVVERGGGFDLLSRKGAELNEIKMKGISKARTGVGYGTIGGTDGTAAAPLIDEAWTRLPNLPAAIFDNAAATIGGKVYSVGGGSGTGLERRAWVYDPGAAAWTALPDLPNARSKPSAAAVGGKLYVLGGWGPGGTPVASVDVFDPATGAWSTLSGTTNPAPRSAAGTAVVGGKVYLVGGCMDSNCTDSANLVIFDPATGTFRAGANYPQIVSWMSCGGIGGKVYCAGGAGATEYSNGYGYDPAADAWSPLPNLPLDLWASQATVAGGLLVLAGGVTAASTAVTNRTVAYDPAAGAWLNLPNTLFSRYRGGAACAAYKIGGSPSSFVGSAETEFLGGLESCDEGGDQPWLTTDPTTFTLAPGASRQVTVRLTATGEFGVGQPGTYTAELGLASDTPYSVPGVPVEMNVSPPANWGKLHGSVTGQTCGGSTVPVPATVRLSLVSDPTVGYTLTADGGGYAYWVPRGRYQVIVAKDGWIPQAKRIQVQSGFVTSLDFTLSPTTPCADRLGGV
ncbi:S8 family serine peptidase [Solwaraspora sp. WMMD1047]|uniref:S8 family serine peptidase n=1 Tax=Solwaraspora sp. WMMD1047 TaxID=3016102 RepID=UPI002416D235|nr:S8 family serine peptidase [Solwaraspora sp. WMMD1047]MDG4833659.1 S8 family serine peptidase [Solwaraspora sp. WMMD1047]